MTTPSQDAKVGRVGNRRVHMANERTFLAWIRTSIAIMAFGFVVERFAIFVKQIAVFLGGKAAGDAAAHAGAPVPGYSSILGIFLVGLGAVMGLLALIRYKRVERQIDEDTYHPSWILDVMLTIAVLAVGVFLVIFLSHSL
jgi:putative membrane protein